MNEGNMLKPTITERKRCDIEEERERDKEINQKFSLGDLIKRPQGRKRTQQEDMDSSSFSLSRSRRENDKGVILN